MFCSSVSSCLNSAAAVTWHDIIKVYGQMFSDAKKTLITKLLGNEMIHYQLSQSNMRK